MMKLQYSIVELAQPSDEQLDELVDLCMASFKSDDEDISRLTLVGSNEETRTKAFFKAVVSTGKVVVAMENGSTKLLGVAAWHKPREKEVTNNVNDAAWPDLVAWKKEAADLLKEKPAGQNHGSSVPWYLHLLAVHPKYQGLGIARAIIEDARKQSNGTELSLHASKDYNIPIYERLGFKLQKSTFIRGPYGNFTMHLLVMLAPGS
ncbi:hypothetical protein L218DRAFT_956466 [Marasmius fiardii PR-910]|nr:hypothetical protein L218DRAFT_956466 [Marasmius fiardii PR-910]